MSKFILIIAISTAPILAYESPIIVEGDGLELVRKYRIEGDQYELVYEDEELAGECEFSEEEYISLKTKINDTENDTLVFINRYLEVCKTLIGNNYSLTPFGINGKYIKGHSGGENPPYRPLFDDQFKDIYNFDDTLLASDVIFGEIIPFPNSDYFCANFTPFIQSDFGDGTDRDILGIRDAQSELVYQINGWDYPIGKTIEPFDKDKNWVIVSDTKRVASPAYPGLIRGTRLFNEEGELYATLNPNIFRNTPTEENYGNAFYGSNNYICQLGQVSKLDTESDYYDVYKISTTLRIEVYDSLGQILWYKQFPDTPYGSIFVSDGGQYILLAMDKGEAVIFELTSGKEILSFPIECRWIGGGYISDDSKIVTLTPEGRFSRYSGHYIGVYVDGVKTATVLSPYEDGILNAYMTPDGDYLIAGVPSCVKVLKIKKD